MKSLTPVLVSALLLCTTPPCLAGVVTNVGDSGPGSLEQEILDAAPGDTITFDSSLAGSQITLGGEQLMVDKNLTIDASSLVGGIAVCGDSQSRVFGIGDGATVAIVDLTITGGRISQESSCGGGISNGGTLTMSDCTVSNNTAEDGGGGGISNDGTLTMNNCIVSGNTADHEEEGGDGGGIYNSSSSTLTMNDCIISGNTVARREGGGITNVGTLTMNNCTVSGNAAPDSEGGGIFNMGTLTMNNCTVSGNTASGGSPGGGIYNSSSSHLTMNNCTVSGNTADRGCDEINNRGTLTLENTIVAGDICGTFVLEGANLIGGDAMLAPLGFYGGFAQTMPPVPGSPAIDSGVPTANTPPTDQRGLPRIFGEGLDIGAYEAGGQDIRPISSISLTPAGLRLAIPPVYFLRVGVEYSTDMSSGSWIELGNFYWADVGLVFTDSDHVRLARTSGYYRAFLRSSPP